MVKNPLFYLLKIVLLAGLYFITAWAGLSFGAVSGFATLVWPPAGIALAVVLLYGYEMWLGIFIGAALINWFTGAPVLSALGIGVGNTLEAFVGAYMLRNSHQFKNSLDNLGDIIRFIILGSVVSTMIAPTIGVTSLLAGEAVMPQAYIKTWVAWWVGDMLGVQIIGSLILVWLGKEIRSVPRLRKKFSEFLFLGIVTFMLSYFIFSAETSSPLIYLTFFPVIWAALNFGPRGVISVSAIISVISIWGTSNGLGPFTISGSLAERLLYLQVFMGSLASTGMILGAVVSERREKGVLLEDLNHNLEDRVAQRTSQLAASEAKLFKYSQELEFKVSERTKEIEAKLAELERLNKFMIGREIKMIQLKDEIKEQQFKLEELREKLPVVEANPKPKRLRKPKNE